MLIFCSKLFCIHLQKELILESLFFYLKWVAQTSFVASLVVCSVKRAATLQQGSRWASSSHTDQEAGRLTADLRSCPPPPNPIPRLSPSSIADHCRDPTPPAPSPVITQIFPAYLPVPRLTATPVHNSSRHFLGTHDKYV